MALQLLWRFFVVIFVILCCSKFDETIASGVSTLEGIFMTWRVNNSDPNYFPTNESSSDIKVNFKFLRREARSASPCKNVQSPAICSSQTAVPLYFFFGISNVSQPYFLRFLLAQFSCPSYSSDNVTMNGYSESAIVINKNYFYKIRHTSCCWSSAIKLYGSSTLNQDVVISFIKDKRNYFNSPVQLKFIPREKVARNERKTIRIPVYDVDNDFVSCRWAVNYAEGGGIYGVRVGKLSQSGCFLDINGSSYQPGMYPVAVVLEDFETSSMTVKFHSVSVQFMVEITDQLYKEIPQVNCSYIDLTPSAMPQLVGNKMPEAAIAGHRPYTVTDTCKNYKSLTTEDRLATYHDWSSYRCDMPLYGWYRFAGEAGIQMLNTCPAQASKSVSSCGTYYKGWLKDQLLPAPGDGSVNRTVCFSKPGSCDCSYTREIKIIHCGVFYLYYLDAVPTCNARYCGKRDSGMTVFCSSNYIQIDLDKSRYNISAYSSITLRSSKCTAAYSPTKISIGTKLDACDTTSRTVSDKIIYENQVILKVKKTGLVSRYSDVFITFSCMFPVHGYAQSGGHELAKEVNATEPGFGQFNLYLDMFISGTYAQKHDKFPVFVRMSDRLYFEASTTASSQYIILLDRCYSTPVKDSNHGSKYFYISERCNVDKNVLFHKTSKAKQRFSVLASDMLASSSKAYLHCIVFMCHLSSNDTRCQSGCSGNNMKRTTRSVEIFRPSTVSKYYLLQVGAVEKENDQSGCGTLECIYNLKSVILLFVVWYFIK